MGDQASLPAGARRDERHEVQLLQLGPMDNQVYIIAERLTGRAAVVDPGWDAAAIDQAVVEAGLSLTDVLISHGHDDHVNALAALLDLTTQRGRAPEIHVLDAEADYWRQATSGPNAARMPPDRTSEVWASPPPARLRRHNDGDRILLGATEIECLATPGHSPGGTCFYLPRHRQLFTGDTLFVYGCGRCDLPGGDARAMFRSLQRLQTSLPSDTAVLPGHRYASEATSTMAEQRRANPFLHFDDAEAFAAFRAEHNRHRHPPYRPVPTGRSAW